MNLSNVLSSSRFVPWSAQGLLAYEWITAGWEKSIGGSFQTTISNTLERFSTNNPHHWYAESVLATAKQSPAWFGAFVLWGELLAGIGMAVSLILFVCSSSERGKRLASVLAMAALAGGAFMNLNFFFAAGWMSPSTKGLNLLMTGLQLVLFVYWTNISKNAARS